MTFCLIFLVGPSGSGKTIVAEYLAKRLGWPFFDTDAMVVHKAKEAVDKIFQEKGEAYFRQLEAQILGELTEKVGNSYGVVATGGGLPAIKGMMDQLLGLGTVVYLAASVDVLWNRLTFDPLGLQTRPLLREGGRVALERMIEEREQIYSMATMTLQTDGLGVEDVVDAILPLLVRN